MKKTFHYYDIYLRGKLYTEKVESLALAEAEVVKYIDEVLNNDDFEIIKSDKTFESEYDYDKRSSNAIKHVFVIEYTQEFVDIDAEETLILALLENDDSAIQYLRKYVKDIRLVNE
jgi:hypothetical protein